MGAGAKKGGASGNRKQLREGAGEGSPEGFPTALTGPRRNMFVSVSLSLHILTFPVQSEKKKRIQEKRCSFNFHFLGHRNQLVTSQF